ncbi:MAG: MAPEG family protein [Emcibacter sp.]|nr:MAPEG family protein [Emcibacter sp.]
MELVAIVIALALMEYVYFSFSVGMARGKYGIAAPAVTGDPIFERYYRVQENTLELLISFIPGMVMFAYYVRPDVAAGLGVIFIIGRALYFKGYIADPKKRTLGFFFSFFPCLILLLGGLAGAIMRLF